MREIREILASVNPRTKRDLTWNQRISPFSPEGLDYLEMRLQSYISPQSVLSNYKTCWIETGP